MLLGQVLERLGDEAFAAETLVALEDLASDGRGRGGRPAVRREHRRIRLPAASRRFADHASDEDWLALMTALERADDAGSGLSAGTCSPGRCATSSNPTTAAPAACTCKGS